MNADNQAVKPSLADAKIIAETDLVLEKIVSEKESRKKTYWQKTVNFLPSLITLISIAAGILALWDNTEKYLDTRKAEEARLLKESNFQYNDKMATLVSSLDDPEATDRSVMLLKYFGRDAIPILLFKLERTKPESADRVVQSILEIYENSKAEDTIFNKITYDAENMFKAESRKPNPNDRNLNGLLNYLKLYQESKIRGQEHLKDFYKSIMTIEQYISGITDEATREPLLEKVADLRKQFNIEL